MLECILNSQFVVRDGQILLGTQAPVSDKRYGGCNFRIPVDRKSSLLSHDRLNELKGLSFSLDVETSEYLSKDFFQQALNRHPKGTIEAAVWTSVVEGTTEWVHLMTLRMLKNPKKSWNALEAILLVIQHIAGEEKQIDFVLCGTVRGCGFIDTPTLWWDTNDFDVLSELDENWKWDQCHRWSPCQILETLDRSYEKCATHFERELQNPPSVISLFDPQFELYNGDHLLNENMAPQSRSSDGGCDFEIKESMRPPLLRSDVLTSLKTQITWQVDSDLSRQLVNGYFTCQHKDSSVVVQGIVFRSIIPLDRVEYQLAAVRMLEAPTKLTGMDAICLMSRVIDAEIPEVDFVMVGTESAHGFVDSPSLGWESSHGESMDILFEQEEWDRCFEWKVPEVLEQLVSTYESLSVQFSHSEEEK